MIVKLASEPAVGAPLLGYLRDRLGVADLGFRQTPTAIPDGWETYIYRFQLQSAALPPAYDRPLILRVYASARGADRLCHEFAVQQHLRGLGYPVPEPLGCETDSTILGGPFMLMEWVPGRTLLDLLFRQPWRILRGPGRMAQLHARLHQLPVHGFPGPPGPFLDRHLAQLRTQIDTYDLHGLLPGLAWLGEHRPPAPAVPSILHLDFHPINLLFQGLEGRAVLDWCDADVGDPHADVAVSLVLIECTQVDSGSTWRKLSSQPGRILLYHLYRQAYAALRPLDAGRLRYYMAWAALRRLGRYGLWLCAGPDVTGSKPTCLRYLNREGIDALCRCFRRQTGVAVDLDRTLARRASEGRSFSLARASG